ncbi:DNA-binding protein [Macrococcus caseolyticus]|uniref:DNA-binding protein n=1 Tax=Macrococcoides caseolyticum TaxID=69966 RepID=UPI000C32B7B6|nr:DNA-binding protein [Macrococcus caseolyticus]MDJ1154518.1 DNA-binding protein [Macrococcus caseolyticus]PKE18645.1 DNA-binding protein [Macrococcus caseolyticus]PKF41705.1 DNA-binding protein [Macrococcus caseolyticus]
MRKEIQSLLDSNISANQIERDTKVSKAVISKLRNKQRNLDDITLKTAETLYKYYKNK